jgi:hypothetical protein
VVFSAGFVLPDLDLVAQVLNLLLEAFYQSSRALVSGRVYMDPSPFVADASLDVANASLDVADAST